MKEHYINLVKGLQKNGIEVTALCNFREVEMEDLRKHNIEVLPFSLKGELNPINDLQALIKVVKILKKQDVDIIHCHGFKAGLIGRMAAWITGCPCVYTIHNFLPEAVSKIKRMAAIWIEKTLFFKTDYIIAVSQALKKYAINTFGIPEDRIEVVYNGIQIPQSEDDGICIRKKWGIKEDDILVGTVARLIRSKGIDFLIKAIPKILSQYPNVKFMIVGSGPEEERLKEFAESLNCSNNIIFAGYVKYIWYYYKAFDIFILPSLSEGLGISVLEAMASSKPVIASNTGGIPEIIEHGVNGYLISPGDSGEISEAILHLILRPEERKRYGDAGYLTVMKKFDNQIMIDRTLDILFTVSQRYENLHLHGYSHR